MLAQAGLEAEAFATQGAPVRFLARVNSLVFDKLRALLEGLPAVRTNVGLLFRMGPLVFDET